MAPTRALSLSSASVSFVRDFSAVIAKADGGKMMVWEQAGGGGRNGVVGMGGVEMRGGTMGAKGEEFSRPRGVWESQRKD